MSKSDKALPPSKRPKLGFLGVGWIGRNRMEALLKTDLVEVCAICDPSLAMMEAAREIAPNTAAVATLEDMLKLELDGVVIATPSALHAKQSIQALASSAAVFCQKPLGRNRKEVEAVLKAARRYDRLLGLDLSYRHTRAMGTIRRLLEERAIGNVYAVDLVFHNAYGPDKPWFYDPTLSGGGCLIDLGVHLVDLLLWALDFPRVRALDAGLFSKGERFVEGTVEDYAVVTLDLETGQVARMACSWKLHAGCDAVISATFHGTTGALSFSNVGGSFYDFEAHLCRGTMRERLTSPPDAWGGRAIHQWASRLALEHRYDPAADQFGQVADVLDRIYQQAGARSRIAA